MSGIFPFLNDDHENVQVDLQPIFDRLDNLEAKSDEIMNAYHFGNSKFQKLEEQYKNLTDLISRSQNNTEFSDTNEIPTMNNIDEEALDKIKEQMQNKFEDLEARLEQKTDNDSFNTELGTLKDAITSLESVKHVDPASHASHEKDIYDLTERLDEFNNMQLGNLISQKSNLCSKIT